MNKICKRCGREFETRYAKQEYCKIPVTLTCEVCGREFETICTSDKDTPHTCGAESCKKQLWRVVVQRETRICEKCGREFHPVTARQRTCGQPITKTCVICGVEFNDVCTIGAVQQTCSKQCLTKFQRKKSVEAMQATTRICSVCGEEFHPTNPAQIVCERTHYRDCIICGNTFVLNTKYNPNEWAHTCSKECNLAYRFRNGNPGSRPDVIRLMQQRRHEGKESEFAEYCKFLDDPLKYMQSLSEKLTIQQLADRFAVHSTTMGQLINKNNLQDYVAYNQSTMENEVVDFLRSVAPELNIVRHDRNVIKPMELDIWLPDLQVGIECNPTSSHNSTCPMFDSGQAIDWRYHQNKTDVCEAVGVRLIHLFGYDWNLKKDIMKSMLCTAIHKVDKRIYARECEVMEVSHNDAVSFLNANHRQGSVNCSVRLGLYHRGQLVSLMTFSRPRPTIGKFRVVGTWELVRFCSILNTLVVGGASKLLKHFLNLYHPSGIVSFSDRARTSGTLYKTLGFAEKSRSDPGYMWVHKGTDVAYNRVNAQKHNIREFLNDPDIDLSQTEVEIMSSHNYLQVFDSGAITWVWQPS